MRLHHHGILLVFIVGYRFSHGTALVNAQESDLIEAYPHFFLAVPLYDLNVPGSRVNLILGREKT
jgi:hypothetical protein